MDMNSKLPSWMLQESAGCFSNRPEEASKNKTEEEEEMGTAKRARITLDGEGGVEEFVCLLERIEEMKRRKRSTNCSGGCTAGIAGEKYSRMNILPSMQQQAQGSDFVSLAPYESTSSPWKPSFQWEDFNLNPLSVQTDLSCAATTGTNNNNDAAAAVLMSSMDENRKGVGGSIQIGNARLKTRNLLDIIADTPAQCSHAPVDDLNNKDEHADAPPELKLRLFPI